MQPISQFCRHRQSSDSRRGFTLIELIVALTVISVAATILVKLYMASTDLGYLAQHRELGATIAEGRLAQLVAEPDAYQWDYQNPDAQGFFRVKRYADDPRAGQKVPLPKALLPQDASFNREEILFDKYRWVAFGRLTGADLPYYEVTVNVHWKEGKKTEHVALVGAVPRSKVDPDWSEK